MSWGAAFGVAWGSSWGDGGVVVAPPVADHGFIGGGGVYVHDRYDFTPRKRKKEEEPQQEAEPDEVVVTPVHEPMSPWYDRLVQSIAAQKALAEQREQYEVQQAAEQAQQVQQRALAEQRTLTEQRAIAADHAAQIALEAEQTRVRTIRRRAALLLLLH